MSNTAGPGETGDTVPNARIGEVISARTSDFVAEADRLHAPPSLGSVALIRDAGIDILAFVTAAETLPKDAGRHPAAGGGAFDSADEFYRQRPEITRLIRTTFSAVIVAHREQSERLLPYPPPRPPRLHEFVYPGGADDITLLANDAQTLTTLASARTDSMHDFLSAAIRTLASVAPSDDARQRFLEETGRRLVLLMQDDMPGLQAVLAKIRPAGAARAAFAEARQESSR